MNFDEFAFMAEANAKTWIDDDYYDLCANEEFGFTASNRSNLDGNNTTTNIPSNTAAAVVAATLNTSGPKATAKATDKMQEGSDAAVSTPVSVNLLFWLIILLSTVNQPNCTFSCRQRQHRKIQKSRRLASSPLLSRSMA